jgi:hypothetical protein
MLTLKMRGFNIILGGTLTQTLTHHDCLISVGASRKTFGLICPSSISSCNLSHILVVRKFYKVTGTPYI